MSITLQSLWSWANRAPQIPPEVDEQLTIEQSMAVSERVIAKKKAIVSYSAFTDFIGNSDQNKVKTSEPLIQAQKDFENRTALLESVKVCYEEKPTSELYEIGSELGKDAERSLSNLYKEIVKEQSEHGTEPSTLQSLWKWATKTPQIPSLVAKNLTDEQRADIVEEVTAKKTSFAKNSVFNVVVGSCESRGSEGRVRAQEDFESQSVMEEAAKKTLKRNWFAEWISPFDDTERKERIAELESKTEKSRTNLRLEVCKERLSKGEILWKKV